MSRKEVDALTSFRLVYCNILYMTLQLRMDQRLQLAKNATARIVSDVVYWYCTGV